MEIAKIKLKVGSMELEYEGNPSFLTGGIEALLVTMGSLASKEPKELIPVELLAQPQSISFTASAPSNFSTNTIAAHFNPKTGPELVICAMTQLELVQGKQSSLRSEILAEMKSATAYYNENYSGNLSKMLVNLTKGKRINQIAKDTYALSAGERKLVEAKLAEIE